MVMETINGERRFYSKKKLLELETERKDGGFMLWCCKLKLSATVI